MAETPYFTPESDFSAEVYRTAPSTPVELYKERLYRAAQRGDWATTKIILQKFLDLRLEPLNSDGENALHVAISSGTAIDYVQKLVAVMLPGDLTRKNVYGHTPLISAIIIGNTDATKLLVHKNPELLSFFDDKRLLPVHLAAQYGKKDILLFLLKAKDSGAPFPYEAELGAKLLRYTMEAEFYDVCTYLITSFPRLIADIYTDGHGCTPPLTMLATNPSAFRVMDYFWSKLYIYNPNHWMIRFRYDHIYRGLTRRGREFPLEQPQSPWRAVRFLTSMINHIRPTESRHYQAIRLVKCLCNGASTSSPRSYDMLKAAFLLAAENGIVVIVETLAEAFPNILWEENADGQNILQIAVLNRQLRVYHLACHIAKKRFYKFKIDVPDRNGNNILHLAAKLALPQHLQLCHDAVLKMRAELRTFEAVRMSLPPFQRVAQSARNNQNKTPREVFSEEHKELRQEGEKWIKKTANSCLIPATLIATLAFSAAIKMPSTTSDEGFKEFDHKFKIFEILNAFSLFTSVGSLLMSLFFLFNATYKEDEMANSLPRIVLALIWTQYASVGSITVTFYVILILTFGGSKKWMYVVLPLGLFLPLLIFHPLNCLRRLIIFLLFTLPKLWKQSGIQL